MKWRYGGVSACYWHRSLAIAAAILARQPFSLGQYLLFERKIKQTQIPLAPVFIIGHWRTGTTYLHEILSRDPRFAVIKYFHALLPWDFLGESRGWEFVMRSALPKQRPMDQVILSAHAPAEDGLALANMGALSFYHVFCFPSQTRQIFNRVVMFEGLSSVELDQLRAQYQYLLQKVSLASGGRRLLLKDPVNTARVPFLLQLFPDAKFIYLRREPEQVKQSMVKTLTHLYRAYALQKYRSEQIEEDVEFMHARLIARYHVDRDLIPAQNLIEIEYEELCRLGKGITREIETLLCFPLRGSCVK